MGGEVGVSSLPDGGSTFWFNLTLPEARDYERLGPQADPAFASLRVLIVDDNATSRALLARTTQLLGCKTETAADGETALDRLRQAAGAGKPFDIVLVDAVMPVMDGITLVTCIRDDARIVTPALVVLGQTGLAGDAGRKAALGQGVSWLNKPVHARTLEDALRKVIGAIVSESVPGVVPLEKASFPGTRVLLAEDNPVIQEVVCSMLKNLGCNPDVVADGRAALAALAEKPYDLALMDCQMPELDGYQVVAALRQREGVARHTPVVALTASAQDGTRERCLAAGMDDYMAKPVLEKDLAAVLTHWCQGAGATHKASGRAGGA
jgi:CheY-like chemotaxis protein